MAVVKGSVIGFLSGKLGHLAARTVKGRTILSARPASFNVSYVPALVEIRKKFISTVAFVKALCGLSALYEIWKNRNTGRLSVPNLVFQNNFAYSSADKPTVNNKLTPDGFSVPVQSATVAADKVTVSLLALNTKMVPTINDRELSCNGLVCYYDPLDPGDKPFEIVSFNQDIPAFDFELPYSFEQALDVVQQNIALRYQHKILYFACSTNNGLNKTVLQYSDTYTLDA